MDIVIGVCAIAVMIPMAVFCLETVLGLLPRRNGRAGVAERRPRAAVLVPAHNEDAVICSTLASVVPQLRPGDRLVVVADNCTDATGELALSLGAEVVDRWDSELRGKSYALDCGMRHLADDPPEVVVILDADCHLHEGSLDALTRQAAALNRPAQAIYLMQSPALNNWPRQVVALGFIIKNLVRPLGLSRLALPCGLNGSGMALPWALQQRVSLASGHIVEDLQLGLDFAMIGSPPALCYQATVTSLLPPQKRSAHSQRTRWEHGTLHTLVTRGPLLLWNGLSTSRLSVVAMALDLLVPPLTLLCFLWAAVFTAALVWAVFGGSRLPVIGLGTAGVVFALVIIAVWARYCRRELPLSRALLVVPVYMLSKVSIYINFLVHRQTKWVRTDRAR